MMRRTRFALAAKASLFRPIFDFLMTKQPGRTSDWARDAALLHKCNVHTPDCWAHLSAGQKQAIVGKGLPQTIADLLDAETSATADNIRHKKVLVAFGSQTGTAESYAKMLSIFATSHGYVPILCSLNDAVQVLEDNKTSKQIDAMLIVTSTYGTGEFPTNSEKFFKDLSAGRLSESLQGIRYTIMGLGNSANDHFNNAAKKIDKSLQAAGAKSFLRTQLSCELQPNGHDNVFRGWKRGIWTALGDASGTATTALPATYEVAMVHAPEKVVARPHYFRAHVQGNILLSKKDYTPESRLLTFTVPVRVQTDELGRRARITDQIQIHPRNCKAAAERAAKLLGVNLKDSVEITPKSGAPHSFFDGRKILVETVLRDIIDLSAAPSRTLIDTVASACADEAERAKLDDLANDLSADSKYTALLAKGFTMMDLLEMCPSIKINMAQLISLAPQIAPRTYSVAKDNSEWLPEEFEICYNIPTKANHKGLCTQMMSQLEVGDDFLMKFIPDVATTPQNKNPLLIVALGSGIGTARSLLHRRKLAKARGEQVGRVCLYYGFRELGNDQLFTKELQEFVDDGLLDVRYVPSTDAANGGKYVTPMDKMDRSIVDFVGAKGEFSYCGLGGSVPLKVESALQKNGVDTAALRASGRYHEEYFTADQDVENLLKHNGVGAADASTLLGRMGNTDMFCFQCEQTQNGKGCTKVGVCGKTSRVAALQDLTVHAAKVIGFYADRLRKMDEPVSNEVNRFTLYSLFATLTNVNFDESRFVDILGNASKHVIQLRDQYKTACSRKGVTPEETYGVHLPVPLTSNVDSLVDLGRQVGVLRRFSDPATQSGAAVSEMLVYGLKGVAAYTDHALMNGREEPQIYEYMHRALAFMAGPDNLDLAKALPLALEAGQANVSSMSLLYNSNKSLGVPTPTVAHVKPVKGKAILVSGHDLIMLKGLLEKTEPLGINVYTHGEMLPAHGYPALKKHKNLVGHYGGAWMRQSVEFPEFPGAIMMTTNCLTEPKESYGDRLFTAGAVGWKGVPHLGNTMADLDFAPLIKSAQEARGFVDEKEFSYADPAGQKRPDSLTVGFGHETILSVAPTLLEAIQKGDITRFFVIGGCDGFEGQRSYYTELVQNLPPTAVILTLGCGKYRLNHLDKGTIGNTGIPRILDMGQCNDAFGAVQVASALASALKCEINDLPLNIVLSWFEQKAVAVLLSCLHLGLKGIHIGPTLPAFVTPEVLNVLVNDFGVRPLGDPAEDAKKMCAGTK